MNAGGQPAVTRVGLFGLLASGNSGNDVSMETMLAYLRDAHPQARVDAMSGGAERMRTHYGVDAIPLIWYQRFEGRASGLPAGLLKALGKGIDTVRIMSWVRRHDVVFVPGAGALEATLPTNAWGFPYALFTLGAAGKLFGTKVAFISVGADTINKPATRWLSNATARLISYRSYRDEFSRDAMRSRGVDVSADRVYPDLAFGMPVPPHDAGDPQTVGVGVMAYYGGNDDRQQAAQIHSDYVAKMTAFTGWLIDHGHRVRLFGGDSKFDNDVAELVLADVRRERPGLEPDQVTVLPAATFADLMQGMSRVGMVVATRYHNVICALKLGKPAIALGYSRKFVSLMEDMGLAEFTVPASSFELDQLIERFQELASRRLQLQQELQKRNAAKAESLGRQFTALSALLFPLAKPDPVTAGQKTP
jgi:polysaccharide pyruvyl transferase WcaK-like protein